MRRAVPVTAHGLRYRLRMGTLAVDGYRIEPLSMRTWDAFADLAERHNGVWGGCWCTYFHRHPDSDEERRALGHREFKRRLVEAGRTHAALVFDGDVAVAWAQFGTVPELWNIHHRKEWEKGVARMPDYRITCLFVDSGYRRAGMAAVAVRGALALIAAAGGGLVEAYPHDLPEGKKILGIVPLQRHPDHVRAARVQLRALQGQGQLRDERGRPGRHVVPPASHLRNDRARDRRITPFACAPRWPRLNGARAPVYRAMGPERAK